MSGAGVRSHEKKPGISSRRTCEQVDPGWTKWRITDQRGRLVGRAGFGGHPRDRELGYTIRRDMWEKLHRYMDSPVQARKVVYEALRRFWLELKEREEKEMRDRLGPNQLN